MPSFVSLVTTLALALTVLAGPIVQIREPLVTMPIARRFNATGARDILKSDQQRAKALRKLAQKAAAAQHGGGSGNGKRAAVLSAPATNQVVTYVATLQVGNPPTAYSLLIDTGSSNTWVGANPSRPFVATGTSQDTGQQVAVQYGSGDFSGEEFNDQVDLGNGLVISGQGIGAASQADGFQNVDGILGVGPTDLTAGTTSSGQQVPTVIDNLFSQGVIPDRVLGISFEPTNSESVTNGELTFGGTDSSKFTGNIGFSPITTTFPASEFWGIDQTITYGGGTPILSQTAGIVDTGTTLVLIASDALQRYVAATGAVQDQTVGLLRVTADQFNALQSLFFATAGGTFELTANAQAFPRSLNTLIGGDPNAIYLIVADLGTPTGQGLDFINGYAFLERFYSVYDTTNSRVGFATTPFTGATTN